MRNVAAAQAYFRGVALGTRRHSWITQRDEAASVKTRRHRQDANAKRCPAISAFGQLLKHQRVLLVAHQGTERRGGHEELMPRRLGQSFRDLMRAAASYGARCLLFGSVQVSDDTTLSHHQNHNSAANRHAAKHRASAGMRQSPMTLVVERTRGCKRGNKHLRSLWYLRTCSDLDAIDALECDLPTRKEQGRPWPPLLPITSTTVNSAGSRQHSPTARPGTACKQTSHTAQCGGR